MNKKLEQACNCAYPKTVREKTMRLWLPAVVLAIGGAFLGSQAWKVACSGRDPAGQGHAVIFEVMRGQGVGAVGAQLHQAGLIRSQRLFWFYGRFLIPWQSVKAGEYELSTDMSLQTILTTFQKGLIFYHTITFKEGLNMFEMAKALETAHITSAKAFLDAARDPALMQTLGFATPTPTPTPTPRPSSLEGYLFPDTYSFSKGVSGAEVVTKMVKHFFSQWGPSEEAEARVLGLSQRDVVILASIVEKETGSATERGLVSAVFHNRLKKKMKLQSDPTTIYGVWDTYDGKIHKKDLLAQNSYNTYSFYGLPVGPICNPGKLAIQAVLHPEPVDYLFFVSRNDGTHFFSKTLAEHNQAVNHYQKSVR
jgi:UPF0755 protein